MLQKRFGAERQDSKPKGAEARIAEPPDPGLKTLNLINTQERFGAKRQNRWKVGIA